MMTSAERTNRWVRWTCPSRASPKWRVPKEGLDSERSIISGLRPKAVLVRRLRWPQYTYVIGKTQASAPGPGDATPHNPLPPRPPPQLRAEPGVGVAAGV